MLVIRLFRVGKKNQPSFKIVVTDKRKPPRAGRFVEEVGFYNPLTKEKVLKQERVKYWISVGAQPSSTVYNLLVSEKIIEGKKVPVQKKSKKEKPLEAKEKSEAPKQAPVPESPAEEKKEGEPVEEEKAEEKAEEKPAKESPKEAKQEPLPAESADGEAKAG